MRTLACRQEWAAAGQVGAAAVQVGLHLMPEAALLAERAAAAHKVEADAGLPAPATLLLALLCPIPETVDISDLRRLHSTRTLGRQARRQLQRACSSAPAPRCISRPVDTNRLAAAPGELHSTKQALQDYAQRYGN